jgi:hypothetical protein
LEDTLYLSDSLTWIWYPQMPWASGCTRFNSAGQPTLPPPPLHKATVSQFKGFNTLTGHGPMLVVDPVNNSSFQSSAQLFVTTAWVL